MAEGTKLVLAFETSTGKSFSLSYKYAKPAPQLQKLKDLASSIVANGSIFTKVPAVAKTAKIVTTTEQTYDVSA